MMRIKVYSLIVLILFVVPFTAQAEEESALDREYQIKAAFLYNFLKFVDWPEKKPVDNNDTIAIGIIGTNPFGDTFEAAKNKKIKGKRLVVKQFPGFEEYKTKAKDPKKYKEEYKDRYRDTLNKCHILFISSSEGKHVEEIIDLVKDGNVLTVGETEDFLERGGIISFITKQKKVRFEINVAPANRAKLKIRSQILRLAKRVVEETPSKK